MILAFLLGGVDIARSQSNISSSSQVNFSGNATDFTGAGYTGYTDAGTGSVTYYIGFDNTYLYIGAFRNTSMGSSDNLAVYIDTDPNAIPTGGTGVTTGQSYNSVTGSLPFSANYDAHLEQSYQEARPFGSSWSSALTLNTDYFVYTTGTSREIKFKLSSLGSPAALYVTCWMGYAGGIYANAPGSNVSGSNPTITNYWGGFGLSSTGCNPIVSTSTPITATCINTAPASGVTYGYVSETSGSYTATGSFNIANGGSINIAGGTLNLSSASINMGQTGLTTGNAATLNYSSGTLTAGTSTLNYPSNGYINGTPVTLNNLTINSGTLVINANPTINGTFQINGGGVSQFGPYYGSGSLLKYNTAGNPTVRALEWSSSSGAGYPYNVQISNNTTIDPGGFTYTAKPFNTAGNLTIDAGSAIYMDYSSHNMTVPLTIGGNLNLNGALSESGASGGDINIAGNWVNNGTGTNFFPNTRAVTFNGAAAQTLGGTNATAASYAFNYLTINNTSGGVSLGKPISVSNVLTLTSGIVTTTTSNTLSLTNTATTAVSGGSTTSFINGPLNWTFPGLSLGGPYAFPIGAGSTYLPLSVNAITATSPVMQAQAFGTGSGGTAGTGLSALSSTEYWHLGTISGTYVGGSVSLTRQTAVAAGSLIGTSSTATGTYIADGGTVSGNSINNSTISAAGYFTIATPTVVIIPPTISQVAATTAIGSQAVNTVYYGQPVTITGTGFTGATNVTIGGTSVAYTVVSNTSITTSIPVGVTSASISITGLTGGVGTYTSYSYLGYIATASGDWNTNGTWLGGTVPPAGSITTVNNTVGISAAVSGAPASITINSGQSLTINNAASAITATTVVNNGTLAWTAAGTLTIAASGTLTNNATFTGGTGSVTFAGAGTVNGTMAISFNNLNISVNTLTIPSSATVPTINGTFTISGGNVSAAPIYGAASTLAYNVTYTRYIEWSATTAGTIGTTPGYPNNVTVNTGTLTLYNSGQTGGNAMAGNLNINTGTTMSFSGYTSAFSVGGNVNINGNGVLNMSAMSGAANVAGNLTIAGNASGSIIASLNMNTMSGNFSVAGNVNNSGSLTLSTTTGVDIYVGGNWTFTQNTGSTAAFVSNGRAVFFNGSSQQLITRQPSAGTLTFDYIVDANTGGGIQLASSPATSVSITAVNTGNGLSLNGTGTGKVFDLNGNALTLGSGPSVNAGIFVTGTQSITSSTGTGIVNISGGSTAGVSGSGTLAFSSAVNVDLSNGFNFGSGLSTINGTLQLNAGGYVNTYPPTYGTNSLLKYNTGATPFVRGAEWNSGSGPGYPYNVQVSNNTTLDPAGTSNASTPLDAAGSLTIDAGSSFYMDYSGHNMIVNLILGSNLNLNGNLAESGTSGGDIALSGNWVNNGTTVNFFANGRAVNFTGSSAQTLGGTNTTAAYAFAYLTINNTSGGVSLGQPITVANALTMTSGILTTTSSNSLTLLTGAGTSGGSTTSYVSGPLTWDLGASLTGSGPYNFPVGGTGYLPFSLSNVSTGSTAPVIKVQAYNTGSGGTADGSTVSSISSTEYWNATVVSGNYTNSSVSMARQSSLGTLNGIARSSTQTGTYSSLGGTVSGNVVNNSNPTGTGLGYFAFAVEATLPQGSLTANGPLCGSGTGQLTWTATAGTGPFTVVYNDGTANRTATGVVSGTAFNVFTDPVTTNTTYTLVSVTDALSAVRSGGFTGSSATITVNTPPAVTITNPVAVCSPSTVDLTASAVTAGSASGLTYTYYTDAAATIPYSTPTAATAGTYYIEGTNASGCSTVKPVVVTVHASPSATASNTGPYLPGQTISLSSGPSGQTSYSWSGPQSYAASGQTATRTGATSLMSGNYVVTVTNSYGCSDTAITFVSVNALGDYVWTGAYNTSWTTVTNWSPTAPAGGPNGCTENVIIPNTVNDPVISSAVSIGNVTINDNAQLTLNAPLSVCGTFTGGTAAAPDIVGSSHLVLNGSSAQNIYGIININYLEINNSGIGVTSYGNVTVNKGFIMTLGNFVNRTTASLTLVSNASGDAYLDNFTSGTAGNYSGDMTVQRYISNAADGYRDLSLPVVTAVSDLNNAYPVTGQNGVECWYAYSPYPNLQSFDEGLVITGANGSFFMHWLSITNLGIYIPSMQGVAFRTYVGSAYTINLTGSPHSGALSIPITHTTTVAPVNDGWNLLGNPYPSPIKWSLVKAMNSAVANGSYYVYNTTAEYAGNWGSFNGTTGVNGATDEISSSQGFFIQTSNASTNFVMDNTVRTTTAGTYQSSLHALDNEVRLVLGNSSNSDEIVTYTDADATDGYDAGIDAVKMPAGSTVFMSYSLGGHDYAINAMSQLNVQTVLPLTLGAPDTGVYTLTATSLNTPGLTAYLRDAVSGTLTDLSAGPVSLTLNGGVTYSGRYSVVFQAVNTATGISTTAQTATKIYSYGDKVYVKRNSSAPATISVTNVLGQDIRELHSNSEETDFELPTVQPWYAIVKVTEGGKVTVAKVLLSNQ